MRRFTTILAVIVFAAAASYAAVPIRITVDATAAPRDLLHTHLTIPAAAGPLTLYYPKWIPGEHGPSGPLVQMAGLRITAGGQPLSWARDPVEMYAILVDVPRGANALEVDFDQLDPVGSGKFSAGGSITQQLAIVSWNTLLLYPASKSSDQLTYEAALRIPAGWKYATALTSAGSTGDEIRFQPETLTRLVDSPVLIGAVLRKIDLPASGPYRHTINIAADGEAATVTPDNFAPAYGRLVEEARALFGSEHYRHYDWLVTLSDNVEHFGLEHHESSDNRTYEDILSDVPGQRSLAGLLAHEYVHSWNGKFRRPAGLAVSNYDQPMTGELLWVYEGMTQYLGKLLAGRSGLWSPEYYREALASTTAKLLPNGGRAWRPLADTAVEAQVLYNAPKQWGAYRRGTDFYEEGVLLWLDADMTIRKLTDGKRSLDDFCRRFAGGSNGDPVVKPYTLDEVVRTLNDVAPYDWAAFFNQRLASLTTPPMAGLEASGWRLVYDDRENEYDSGREIRSKEVSYLTSLGFSVGAEGVVSDVIPGSPAAVAGIVPGAKLLGVNGRRYTPEILRVSVRDGKSSSAPMEVIYSSGEFVRTAAVNYHDGLRHPHLQRIPNTRDRLADLLAPAAAK